MYFENKTYKEVLNELFDKKQSPSIKNHKKSKNFNTFLGKVTN
jgi:hypothetical protein